MKHHPQPPSDSPAGLQRYIAAARAQPIAKTSVTADAIVAGVEAQRRRTHTRRNLLLSASIAVAASVVAALGLWPILSAHDDHDGVRDSVSSVVPAPAPKPSEEDLLAPASAVRLRSSAPVEVLGPWSIALHEGTHEIELAPQAERALAIALPSRSLELVEGSLTIEFVDGDAAVRLHTGVAAWIGPAGQRTQISVEHLALQPSERSNETASDSATSPSAGPSAAELARSAEQALAAGRREEAMAIHRQLVRKHPRASQTRAAVLDLARLLRRSGQADEARCAYRLYLERWPKSSVRAEVEAQLDRLGEGPRCRGLTPID